VKALLGGGGAAAVKVAATALAVAATTVAAATEVPRHAHHAQATKPAPVATQHLTRQSRATIAPTASTAAATNGSVAHRAATRPNGPASSSARKLPTPVALPASHPDATISAPAPAQPASAPEAPPAPLPSSPEPALPAAASAAPSAPTPADNGHGNGKADKEERTTQATTEPTTQPTTQPTEATPTETKPVPVIAEPPVQPVLGSGNDKRTDKLEKPATVSDGGKGNDNGKGNGKRDK
jgi:hypothetical protein